MENRTIKIRAWDDRRKLMIYDFENIQHPAAIEYSILAIDGVLQIGASDVQGNEYWLDILEYTGLHDKNGKEIYEGDIFKHETQSPFANDKPFETEIGIVEWGVWSYMYGFIPGKPMFAFDRMKARHVEIIGTIYENESLLKQ